MGTVWPQHAHSHSHTHILLILPINVSCCVRYATKLSCCTSDRALSYLACMKHASPVASGTEKNAFRNPDRERSVKDLRSYTLLSSRETDRHWALRSGKVGSSKSDLTARLTLALFCVACGVLNTAREHLSLSSSSAWPSSYLDRYHRAHHPAVTRSSSPATAAG